MLDDDEKIPYLVGEIFIFQDNEQTQASLEDAKNQTENEIGNLKVQVGKIKDQMSDLKVHLYSKFGNHINLEADED